jgi:hypothetical protein
VVLPKHRIVERTIWECLNRNTLLHALVIRLMLRRLCQNTI